MPKVVTEIYGIFFHSPESPKGMREYLMSVELSGVTAEKEAITGNKQLREAGRDQKFYLTYRKLPLKDEYKTMTHFAGE